MAQNNLRISIVAQLDSNLSLTQINTAIKGLEKKVNALNLKIKMDSNILSTLNNFTKQMEKVSTASLKANQIIQQSNQRITQSIQNEIKSVQELTRGYAKLNEQIKRNADGSVKSITSTYQNAQGNGRSIVTDADKNVINYKDIENISKFQKEQDKLRQSLQELGKTGKYTTDELRKIGQSIGLSTTIRELDNLKNRMVNLKVGNSFKGEQDKVTQSLKKMYDQGIINEKFFSNFNKVINSTKNVAEIEKVKQALQRVSDAGKNKNLQQDLLSQANTLLNGKSKKMDTTGVTELINKLKAIKPNATSASNELQRLQNQLKEYQANARVAAAHTLTFGSALKQALAGFSLWSLTATMVYAPVRAFQDMTQRLIEIDTLMTDIRRVMNLPDFKFTGLLQEAVNTSDQLSTKLTDVLSIMGEFGRMGFSENQLTDITKTAQVLQNISDLNAEDSVNTLTSAMLNFNIAAEDSITIAD